MTPRRRLTASMKRLTWALLALLLVGWALALLVTLAA